MKTKEEKQEKLRVLLTFFMEKAEFHMKKIRRARSLESINLHDRKRQEYSKLETRARNLFFRLRREKKAFESDTFDAEYTYKYAQRKKAENKEKFEKLRNYSPWFFSDSFRADYGSFTCDKCKSTFHHSPSTITQGVKTLYECCCGYCTNSIIRSDWSEEPFG